MTYDVCLMNPPYGAVGGDTIQLRFVDKLYDLYNDKMVVIMPFNFINNEIKPFKKYQEKFIYKLKETTEIKAVLFEDVATYSNGIYEFDNNISKTTTIKYLNGRIITTDDTTTYNPFYNDIEDAIGNYLLKDEHIILYCCGKDGHGYKYNNEHMSKEEFDEWSNNSIIKSLRLIEKDYKDKIYLITNVVYGGQNGTYMSSKTGQIIKGYDNLYKYFQSIKPSHWVIVLDSIEAAENLKAAMKRDLLRFILWRTQKMRCITVKQTYKYIPNIDWTDERTKTDEGILEVCGCPKDKCKEYVEYCKNIVKELDEKHRNRKLN